MAFCRGAAAARVDKSPGCCGIIAVRLRWAITSHAQQVDVSSGPGFTVCQLERDSLRGHFFKDCEVGALLQCLESARNDQVQHTSGAISRCCAVGLFKRRSRCRYACHGNSGAAPASAATLPPRRGITTELQDKPHPLSVLRMLAMS
jgi:hypothetical protein